MTRGVSGWVLVWAVLGLLGPCSAVGADVIPPKPARYFNDYASVVSSETAEQLNQALQDFERATSSQIVVAIFPKMQSDSSVEDFTVRVAQAWGVGQKGKNNGAVLFAFIEERQLYLQVGYGLEGSIPDATAKTIIEQEIKPLLRNGDFDGGFKAGVNAILQAARGEYHGTGKTVAEQRRGHQGRALPFLLLLIVLLLVVQSVRRSQGTVYRRSGRSAWSGWPGGWGGGGWGGRGGGSSGGGGFSGGGGGFSGGGGSFGGGGAGGKW